MAICRFCKTFDPAIDGRGGVKYGVRHYAHFDCYLNAGKSLDDLPLWQVGRFPYRLLKHHGLLDQAKEIYDLADALR